MLASNSLEKKLKIGPFHPDLAGPLKIEVALHGDRIREVQVESGFAFKNLERLMFQKDLRRNIILSAHVDPECPLFYERLYVEALERCLGLGVTQKDAMVRTLVCELMRLSSHLLYWSRICQSLDCKSVIHYLLRDRELLADIFEILTGSRFCYYFLKPGGNRAPVTEGWLEKVIEAAGTLKARLQEYSVFIGFNRSVVERTQGKGILTASVAAQYGIDGPNFSKDQTDIYDRIMNRFKSFDLSCSQIVSLVDSISQIDVSTNHIVVESKNYKLKKEMIFHEIEGPRGMISCFLGSSSLSSGFFTKFFTPSEKILLALPDLLLGIKMSDLFLVLCSLDLNVAEADR